MRATKHIGTIAREHAEAGPAPMKRKRKGRSPFTAIASHRAFLPILALWGASLLGLIMMVLPDRVIASIPALTGIEMSLMSARFGLAFVASLAGGLLGLVLGGALRSQALKEKSDEGAVISAFKARAVQPIDPSTDLGSDSLDAPFEATEEVTDDTVSAAQTAAAAPESPAEREPTLGELSRRGYELEAPETPQDDDPRGKEGGWSFTRKHFKEALIESCEGATCEAAETFAPAPNLKAVATTAARPREMGLAEFGDLPGRNAVWVEDPASSGLQSRTHRKPSTPTPASALEKLRQTPPDQLSLVEMVERFAAALHEHQNQERARMALGQAGRDAALAEALKALTLFTERGFDQGTAATVSEGQIGRTERELREALARLQDLRGAA